MTETVSTKPLTTLTAEMADFLGLGPDLDLPALGRVSMQRWSHRPGWEILAYADERDAAHAIDTVYAWARYAGSTVRLRTPYAGGHMPSGWQLSLEAQIVIAEVPITIAANLDADAYAEAMAADRPHFERQEPVHVTGEAAALLIGGASA